MKRNLKIVSLAAAALLAVSPVLVEAMPASAAAEQSVNVQENSEPVITYQGINYRTNQRVNSIIANVPVRHTIDVNALKAEFSAQSSSRNNECVPVKVDVSRVDTLVAGIYPVTVSATNSEGRKTTLTMAIKVGNSEAINHLDSVKMNKGKIVIKTVMHSANAYNRENMRATKKVYKLFSHLRLISQKVIINGVNYYPVANSTYYVKADNIDGTKRTLKHNAYVYATARKRANRKILKKGKKVVTFGGSFVFRNGQRYFRVGKGKQYVKVSAFR